MDYEYLIKNCTIVDGTGNKAFTGSLVLKKGKIAEVLNSSALRASGMFL